MSDETGTIALLRAYRNGVEALWASVPDAERAKHPRRSAVIAGILDVDDARKEKQRFRDIYRVELLMAAFLPPATLQAEGARRLVEAKALGMRSLDAIEKQWNAAIAAGSDLLPIYVTLMDDLHWLYSKRALDRRTLSQLTDTINTRIWVTLAIVMTPFVVFAFNRQSLSTIFGDYATYMVGLYIAVGFGALGAMFSRATAFQTNRTKIDYDMAVTNFVQSSLSLRQLIGVIGAIVLFFAIYGELVGGNLFPKIGEIIKSPVPVWPSGDAAKLVFWSFLAGFSERLIPDLLTRNETVAQNAGKPNG